MSTTELRMREALRAAMAPPIASARPQAPPRGLPNARAARAATVNPPQPLTPAPSGAGSYTDFDSTIDPCAQKNEISPPVPPNGISNVLRPFE